MTESEKTATSGRRLKLVRLLDEYNLDGVGDQLADLWTATGDRRLSLRELATYFNRELLRTALAEAGASPLDGEVENTYRLLTDDDAPKADRTRAQRHLEREGVDVNQLQRDFVTYQAIRSYLTEYRDESYTAATRDRATTEHEHIQRLRGRVLTVTESKLDQLQRTDAITLGDYQTFVEINVLCEDCGAQYGIDALLDRGGCECTGDEASD